MKVRVSPSHLALKLEQEDGQGGGGHRWLRQLNVTGELPGGGRRQVDSRTWALR